MPLTRGTVFDRLLGRPPEALARSSAQTINQVTLDNLERIAFDHEKPWKDRQKAVREIGILAQRQRLERETLFDFKRFAVRLLSITTNMNEPESLQGTAAWALSQVNEWPQIFNKKVLDSKESEKHTDIDTSLPFLPSDKGVQSVTDPEATALARRFMPHLDGHGFELRWDTKDLYLGPFFRVLKDPDSEMRRCVQYIYMWSKQNWPISQFYTSYFWGILGLLVLFQHKSLATASVGMIILSSSGVLLLAFGLLKTFYPHRKRVITNDSWFAPAGLLLIGGVWWDNFIAPYFLLLLAASFLIFVRVILRPAPEHHMDYEPVYVYLKKSTCSDWSIERVRYDSFHYDVGEQNKSELGDSVRSDTIFLKTDNMWRSFQLDSAHSAFRDSTIWFWSSVLIWCGYYGTAAALLLPEILSPMVTFPRFLGLDALARFAFGLSAPLVLIVLNKVVSTPISAPSNSTQIRIPIPTEVNTEWERRILTYPKLTHLWNMIDDKANLVIRRKLQVAFRTPKDKSYWGTFRDPSAERLAYEALKMLGSIKSR